MLISVPENTRAAHAPPTHTYVRFCMHVCVYVCVLSNAGSKLDGPKCYSPAAPLVQAWTQILGERLNGCREIVFAVQLMAWDWFCWNVPQSEKTRHSAVMRSDHPHFAMRGPRAACTAHPNPCQLAEKNTSLFPMMGH